MSKSKPKRNKRFTCTDCKCDTGSICEHYFVETELWSKFASITEMLCIGCFETRIGRKLNKKDFTKCYLNDLKNKSFQRSSRLIDRLTN